MGHAKKVDLAHAEIRDGLRDCGYKVFDSSMFGRGFPDLVVLSKNRQWVLLEIKDPKKGLTQAEWKFHNEFAGAPLFVVYSLDQALEMLNFYLE